MVVSNIDKSVFWCNGNPILTSGIKACSQVQILRPSSNTEGEIVGNFFSAPLKIRDKGLIASYAL